jgi:hypothetical protein
MRFATGVGSPTEYMRLTAGGGFGVGTTNPTAKLHIGAGSIGTAPVKLTAGTALATPADGAVEYHDSHLYFTIGSTRYQIDQQSGLSDGDKGDITVSGTGTVWTLDNNVVTYEKIQDMATSRILGRTSASSGDIEELTVSNGLTLASGAVKLGGSLTGNTDISGGGAYNLTTTGLTSVQLNAIGSLSMSSAGSNASIYVLGGTLQTFQIGGSGGAVLDLGSDATGDIYYRTSGGKFVQLPIGTQGQALVVSASGIPEWSNTVTQATKTGTSYEIVTTDNGTIIPFSNAGAITVNIPTGLPDYTSVTILRLSGAGVITFTSDGTLEGAGDTLDTEKTAATIYHRGSNIHTVLGAVGSSGSGITNSAGNNEIPKSDGTDIGPSGIFSTTAGQITLGSSDHYMTGGHFSNVGYVEWRASDGIPISNNGKSIILLGGDAYTGSGDGNGGSVELVSGAGNGTGTDGGIFISAQTGNITITTSGVGNISLYGASLSFNNSEIPTLDLSSSSTAGGTITLDLDNKLQAMFDGSATFSTAKIIALSNAANALLFNFFFEVTNVAAVLTFPGDWLKNATDFDGSDWTPPSTGKYELAGSWNGTNWYIKIDGPFI